MLDRSDCGMTLYVGIPFFSPINGVREQTLPTQLFDSGSKINAGLSPPSDGSPPTHGGLVVVVPGAQIPARPPVPMPPFNSVKSPVRSNIVGMVYCAGFTA